ncbi:matrixin [Paludibacterium purpuratum]|uniref:Matrixin n=2 Tax=Paludibacterium purpuratum TaxID=1144873 RepID=A0A4R7B320_9NEIS|nr:matrixin [Paludibacterium purpuratum]
MATLQSLSTGVNPFELEGGQWSQSTVSWSTTNIGTDAQTANAINLATQQAFAQWSAITGLHFQQTQDPAQANIQIKLGDFNTAETGIIGYTGYTIQSGQFTSGTAITIENPNETALATNALGELQYSGTEATLEQVLLHEIGHALGFAANADSHSIMDYALTANNRTFDDTDTIGAANVYHATPPGSNISAVNQLVQALSTFGVESAATTSATNQSEVDNHPNDSLAVHH